MEKNILVVGSINMDLVVKTDEIPGVGETLIGNELLQIPGGKGANQGVAIAKLNNRIKFLGKLGEDSFGDVLLESMEAAGVDVSSIERETDVSTGIAVINVDKKGNNNITVISGANNKVDIDYLNRNRAAFKWADAVVFQFEVPMETVKEGLKISKEEGCLTIVNPAPASDIDDAMIENIDILIPNEHELSRIAKIEVTDEESVIKAGNILLNKGIKHIIVTLGSKGVMYIDNEGQKMYEAYKVEVVDTTGAGDSFIGGFVSNFVVTKDIDKAIEIGQKTAALAIQKVGAQSSLPTKADVEKFI